MNADNSILPKCEDLLKSLLPTSKDKIIRALQSVELLRPELLGEVISARSAVLLDTAKFRRPAEKGLTDYDRRILTNELLADTQSRYETLAGIFELLSERREDLLALLRSSE